jgi:hypothetical protein
VIFVNLDCEWGEPLQSSRPKFKGEKILIFDRLSVGGYVIVDDYGEDSWTYCRRAVDEFRAERSIEDPMIAVDSKCFYWQRTR